MLHHLVIRQAKLDFLDFVLWSFLYTLAVGTWTTNVAGKLAQKRKLQKTPSGIRNQATRGYAETYTKYGRFFPIFFFVFVFRESNSSIEADENYTQSPVLLVRKAYKIQEASSRMNAFAPYDYIEPRSRHFT